MSYNRLCRNVLINSNPFYFLSNTFLCCNKHLFVKGRKAKEKLKALGFSFFVFVSILQQGN